MGMIKQTFKNFGLYNFLLFLFDRRVPFEGRWVFSELIGAPLLDGFFAFVWVFAPLKFFEKIRGCGGDIS
jgi:hypothetical protein